MESAPLSKARAQLQQSLAHERDANVRQDLQIMIDAATRRIEGSELNERLLLDWNDVPGLVFQSEQDLLQDQSAPARRAKALVRLNRYLGLAPGTESIFAQAKARFADSLADGKRLGPVKAEVEQAIANAPTYAAGVRKLRTMLSRDNTLILSFFRSQGMMAGPFIPLEMDLEA